MRLSPFVFATALSLSACAWPGRYSDTKSGRILDPNGAPLGGTYVVTQVYRECGSLGGAVHQRLKTSYVATDAEGRYKRSVGGMTWQYIIPNIAFCAGYTIDDYACRGGYGCSLMKGSDATLTPKERRLEGVLYEMPPEVRADTAYGCAQEKWARSEVVPGWVAGVQLKYRWYCSPDLSPMVEVEDPGAVAWIVRRVSRQGGKATSTIKFLPPGKFVDPGLGKGTSDLVYLFALGNQGSGMRPIAALSWGINDSRDLASTPVVPSVPDRNAWSGMLYEAKTQLPIETLRRLPASALNFP